MSTVTQPPQIHIIPDSPSGTLPSTHSDSDWQSLHVSNTPTPPTLLLDASTPLLAKCRPTELPTLLDRISKLEIPIRGLDAAPEQLSSSGKWSYGAESLLGSLKGGTNLVFGTKVSIQGSYLGSGRGELHPENIRESLRASLHRTRRKTASWLIAQRPDSSVSLGEVSGGFEGLVGEGLCEMWGVRDFRTRNLRDLLTSCRRRGYLGPRIYQGEYNLLWRRRCEARMPLIREHGMCFHAYEPLAQGTLSTVPTITRPSSQPKSTAWRSQYDSADMQLATQHVTDIAAKYSMTLQSAALRWLAYHSQLGQADSIILGGSTIDELEEKVAAIAKGPLPEEMVAVLDRVGEELRDGRPVTPTEGMDGR